MGVQFGDLPLAFVIHGNKPMCTLPLTTLERCTLVLTHGVDTHPSLQYLTYFALRMVSYYHDIPYAQLG